LSLATVAGGSTSKVGQCIPHFQLVPISNVMVQVVASCELSSHEGSFRKKSCRGIMKLTISVEKLQQ